MKVIVAAQDAYSAAPRLTGAVVKLETAAPILSRALWSAYGALASDSHHLTDNGLLITRTNDLPGLASKAVRRGDLLVVNSVRRLDLRRLIEVARRRGCRVVWYLREPSSLTHASEYGRAVDVLIANSRPLAAAATERAGTPCGYVRSAIDRADLHAPHSRDSLLLVNPLPAFGLNEAIAIAGRLSQQKVILQESWTLDPESEAIITSRIEHLVNVELRHRCERSSLFRDSRALLAPYSADVAGLSRPRVVLEAQLMGVPVIAHDVPGLAATTASPELLVPIDAGIDGWLRAVERLNDSYDEFCTRAREFADSELSTPSATWAEFAAVCGIDKEQS